MCLTRTQSLPQLLLTHQRACVCVCAPPQDHSAYRFTSDPAAYGLDTIPRSILPQVWATGAGLLGWGWGTSANSC